MAAYRPKSILQLILIGFVVVTVPLILALITATMYVDRLTKHGQRSVLEAANAVQSSRMLVEHVTAMERSARQFQVLEDEALFDVYLARRSQFEQAVEEMQALDMNQTQRAHVAQLINKEQSIFDRLSDPVADPDVQNDALADFSQLNALARRILTENSQLIGKGVGQIQELASRAQHLLVWETLALIPAALLFSGLFTALIIKPLRQLDYSIRQLGDGRFDTEINVKGPDDLRELGKRLEWMRIRLLELENQKVMFLRHISHELKTPLTTIREGAELLNEQVVGSLNSEQMEIARMLKQHSVQLQRIIEDLLNFNTLQSSSHMLRQDPVQLDQLVRYIISNHKLAAKSKSLRINSQISPLSINGDWDKLRIIVDNLLSNAIKYSPAGGEIQISLAPGDDGVVLDVRDEGPGIPADEKERIFEAFYQGRVPAKGHVKGSGLGLSIVKEFVKLHHGTIEIVDEEIGAHIRVTLPSAVVAEQTTQPAVQA